MNTPNWRWYHRNILLLASYLARRVEFDDEDYTWFRVPHFPLPDIYTQRTSRLLILTPGVHQPITLIPTGYYLDMGLATFSGLHPGNVHDNGSGHGCPDLSHLGYAWHCLILKGGWYPAPDADNGENYITIVNTVFRDLAHPE